MAELFANPWFQPLSGSVETYAGAKLYFYQTGTTTAQNVYTDAALSVAHTNPVVADAAGRFAPIYLDPAATAKYKAVLKDSADTTLLTVDPVSSALAELASVAATTDGAANVAFKHGGSTGTFSTGAQATTLQKRNDRWWDFAADSAASTVSNNSTTLLEQAAAACKLIFIPPGTYTIDNSGGAITIDEDDVRIVGIGNAKLKGTSATNDLFNLTGENITIEHLELEGPGTYVTDASTRNALVNVTGDYCHVRKCTLTNPPTCGVHGQGAIGLRVTESIIQGGPTADPAPDTAHFGIRLMDSYKFNVTGNIIKRGAGNGVTLQGIFIANTSAVTDIDGDAETLMHDGFVDKNTILNVWDKGVYANTVVRIHVTNNTVKYSGNTGLSIRQGFVTSGAVEKQGNVVTNNSVYGVVNSVSYGISMYDAHYANCSNNNIYDCDNGIQVTEQNYNGPISGNSVCGNVIRNFITNGIVIGNTGATAVFGNVIDGNVLIGDASNATATGQGIVLNGSGAGTDTDQSIVSNNVVANTGNIGINLNFATKVNCHDNVISNPAANGGGSQEAGIWIDGAVGCTIKDNQISDLQGSPTMQSGIDGNNTATNCTITGNTIRGAQTVGIRRCQQASNGSTFLGNRTGDNALAGTIALTAGTSTTLANDNVNTGAGYTSYLVLYPFDSAAAAITPYVTARTAATSFTLTHATAAGGETYYYEIKQ